MLNILGKIKPSIKEQKELEDKIKKFLAKLNKNLSEEILIGGSYGKGTWLSGNHDIDVFVLYKDDKDISNRLEKLVKKSFFRVSRVHGSRDYFQVKFKELLFEVIPVLKITKITQAKNITDASPLHIKWVRKNTNEKLRDEIRLVKQFCKAQRIYGAETYIKGFSGHVLEILTVKYGSFEKLLKNAIKFKEGMVIGKGRVVKDKLSPLIVIDPSDENRNAAAALSEEKFNKFIEASKAYLKNPSEEFFIEKQITKKDLKDKDLVIEAYPLEGKKDNVGTKLLKVFEFIKSILNREGFQVTESDWYWKEKEALLWFNLKNKEIDKIRIHQGPPSDKKQDVKRFKEKHNETYVKNGRLYVNLEIKNNTLEPFIKELLKSTEIKEKVKKIKITKI